MPGGNQVVGERAVRSKCMKMEVTYPRSFGTLCEVRVVFTTQLGLPLSLKTVSPVRGFVSVTFSSALIRHSPT